MKSGRHLSRLLAISLLLVGTGVVVGGPSIVRAADTLGSGGEFHALTPARIFDSRPTSPTNDVAPPGAKPLGTGPSTFDISLLGKGGIPDNPLNVLAVVVNITVTEPGASGYLEAYGTGARPDLRTSIINFVANQTAPNVAIVRPGDGGMLTIGLFGQSGTANVIIDVFGWFSTSNYIPDSTIVDDGARLWPTTPSRILDTRDGTGQPAAGAMTAKQTIELKIRGANGFNPPVTPVVPDSPDITGVLLNVVGLTTEPGGKDTFISVFPDALPDGQAPTTSNLNLPPNVIKANLVFVPVGKDGKVRIYNHQGNTQVVADVVGYMYKKSDDPQKLTRVGRVVPLSSPYRTLDTRAPLWGSAALGPGQAEDWSFALFASSVTINSVPVGNQLGVIGNLTSAELKRQYTSVKVESYLTVYPTCPIIPGSPDPCRPTSSNLNTIEGPPVPNMAVLKYGTDNTVRVYNNAGLDQYIFDASAVVLND